MRWASGFLISVAYTTIWRAVLASPEAVLIEGILQRERQQRFFEVFINWSRREQIELQFFEFGIVISGDALGIRLFNFGGVHHNLASGSGEPRSGADRSELLNFRQLGLFLYRRGDGIPRLAILTSPLGIGGNLGAQIGFFLLFFIEQIFIHAVVFAGYRLQGIFQTEDQIR